MIKSLISSAVTIPTPLPKAFPEKRQQRIFKKNKYDDISQSRLFCPLTIAQALKWGKQIRREAKWYLRPQSSKPGVPGGTRKMCSSYY